MEGHVRSKMVFPGRFDALQEAYDHDLRQRELDMALVVLWEMRVALQAKGLPAPTRREICESIEANTGVRMQPDNLDQNYTTAKARLEARAKETA